MEKTLQYTTEITKILESRGFLKGIPKKDVARFLHYLRKKNLLKEYYGELKNCSKMPFQLRGIHQMIDIPLVWDSTEKGFGFWETVDMDWIHNCNQWNLVTQPKKINKKL